MKRDRPIILDGDADGPGAELETLFGRLREQGPDAEATRRATGRAREVLVSDAAARPRAGGVVGWRPLVAAAGVLLGVVVWFTLLGGELATPVWADVVRQSAGFETVKLTSRNYDGRRALVGFSELFVQRPSTLRIHDYDTTQSPPVMIGGQVMTPARGLRWNLQTGLSEFVDKDNPYVTHAGFAGTVLGLVGVAAMGPEFASEMTVNGQEAVFVPVEAVHPLEAGLRGFRVEKRDGAAWGSVLDQMIYWFAADENVLRRISNAPSSEAEALSDVEVVFDPDLPDGFFGVKPAQGTTDVDAGLQDRLPEAAAEVYAAARSARERLGDYRVVIWMRQIEKSPVMVESRRGRAWRANELDWSRLYTPGSGLEPLKSSVEVAEAWGRAQALGLPLKKSAFHLGDNFSQIFFGLSGRGPRVSARIKVDLRAYGASDAWGFTLHEVAWPAWESRENLHPHSGRELQEPLLTWRRLPADPAHPSWVTVEGKREVRHGLRAVQYVFDADRDWLCVRHERIDSVSSTVVRIAQMQQNAQGRWVPQRVLRSYRNGDAFELGIDPERWGQTYDYRVSSKPAEEAFFDWPEDVPAPEDVFSRFRSRRLPANHRPSGPPTAHGKFTAVGSNGNSQRGFDDKASRELHHAMLEGMQRITDAVTKNRHDHHQSRLVFPATLTALVDLGYLRVADLKNPLYPRANPGFAYLPPNPQWVNPTGRIMLYEPFEVWPGVVTLMFGDGSTEYIHDEAEFERLLEAARSPEDPPRRGE